MAGTPAVEATQVVATQVEATQVVRVVVIQVSVAKNQYKCKAEIRTCQVCRISIETCFRIFN